MNKTDTEREVNARIAANLARLMDARGISQEEVAEHMGVSQSAVSTWVRGEKLPRMDKIDALADYFGVKRSDLMDESKTKQSRIRLVPVLGIVAAGEPIYVDENIDDYIDIQTSWDGEYFGLTITGTSMEPRMLPGDIVVVRRQDDVDDGSVAVVIEDGENATVKRVYKSEAGITLVANNPSVYPTRFYSRKEIRSLPVQIIGEVVEVRGKP